MYYGPTLIVSQFGFDIYTSTVVLNVADLLTYYPLMLIVDKIRRKKALIIQFLVATVISGIMIFLVKPEDCDSCIILYVQLVLIFIFRFAISMEFALMNVYQTELYPTRIRNIAGGVLGVFGTIASTTSPLIMGAITRA
jgi:MFS family permease